MTVHIKKYPPALKHGGYTATTILPGESEADFEKLLQDVIAELNPVGALEEDAVTNIARLTWRKQNLPTFRLVERAKRRQRQLIEEQLPILSPSAISSSMLGVDPALHKKAAQIAFEQTHKEFADVWDLVVMGEEATVEGLLHDLDVQDRLDAKIDKYLKRLLQLKGIKSLSAAPFSAPAKPATA
jgi:hypothetical protein